MKIFFIKLISIALVIIISINIVFNLIFAERLEKLDAILMLDRSDIRQEMREKIRNEIKDSLEKENLIYEEDKILLYKLYEKLKKPIIDSLENRKVWLAASTHREEEEFCCNVHKIIKRKF